MRKASDLAGKTKGKTSYSEFEDMFGGLFRK
jgi:hypothetical protein